ncbi:MAG: 4Fe-4S dicluster domain-containing protein [Erysipelotrichaceae bacterium]
MSLFNHEARQFEFDVLKEVCKRTFEGTLNPDIADELALKLIPKNKADFRCCIYKEREIIRQRTKMALGKLPDGTEDESKQIVHVIEAACDGCTIKKIRVTDNCRKCMAKSCIASCKFDAIGPDRAFIDYDKCKECGACANACPFNAIVETKRPCKKSCPVDAISMDENDLAIIDQKKCINCGACQAACPFGAIEDISWIVPIIDELKKGTKMIAMFAPALQGQFVNASINQIKKSIKLLGFNKVYEVASGADAVAYYEKEELKKHLKDGEKLTTSCCPAFVNMARLHFPSVYEKNVSKLVSPMIALARYLKANMSDHKIVFIGPCVAKKQEAINTEVDYVLTFEEFAAMLVSKEIAPDALEITNDEADDEASAHGRNFAIGGGVANALKQALKEEGSEIEIQTEYADGSIACKKNLMLLKAGRFNADVLEGMACVGGCINGPATIDTAIKVKQRMNKENETEQANTITSTLEKYDFSNIDLHK